MVACMIQARKTAEFAEIRTQKHLRGDASSSDNLIV